MTKSAIDYAKEELGLPYVFGAENPGVSFDCSGLVQWAYQQAGYKLPRTADQQYHATQRISYKDARPGDLVYFLDNNGKATHTGIYLGNGEFLEAPHTGSVVKVASVNVHNVVFGRVPGAKGAAGAEAAASVASNPDDYQSYGYVQDLANSVPEIKQLLQQASAAGWSPQRFQDQLQTTQWWKTNSDSAKKMIALAKADPAEYRQEQTAAQNHVKQMAASLGVNLTTAQIASLATADLYQGLDDATLSGQIGHLYSGLPTSAGGAAGGGQAVTMDQQIRTFAAQNGVPVTDAFVNGWIKNALQSGQGAEGAMASITKQAMQLYPTLTAALQSGQTVTDAAQPFIAQMAQTLEIDPSTISLQDPTIQKALLGKLPSSTPPAATGPANPSGAGTVKTGTKTTSGIGVTAAPTESTSLNDFQDSLRNDPRWETTDNAKASAYSLVEYLGSKWGFAS